MEPLAIPEDTPQLVLHAPTLQQEFGTAGFALLAMALLIPGTLLIAVPVLTGNSAYTLGTAAIVGLSLILIAATLGLMSRNRARIVLTASELVEYNALNLSRKFAYKQIREVKPGSRAGSLWLRYYPMTKAGQIDYTKTRGARLITVRDTASLQRAILARMTAPPPTQEAAGATDAAGAIDAAGATSRPIYLLLLLVLVIVLALVYVWPGIGK